MYRTLKITLLFLSSFFLTMATVNKDEGECAIGLELFANNVPGFSAIYKTLKSDFIVKEITETGEVCSLTELEPRVDQELERKEKEMLENTLTTTTTAKEEDDGKLSLIHI